MGSDKLNVFVSYSHEEGVAGARSGASEAAGKRW
jgi:hypothetical protein